MRQQKTVTVAAVWSVPRLGFMNTFHCILGTLPALGIPVVRGMGAFWGQAMELAMERAIADYHADWLVTLDYDSVFCLRDLRELLRLAVFRDDVDALCPQQWHRSEDRPLWTPKRCADGSWPEVTDLDLDCETFELETGHFGLSLIRVASLQRMPHPWFLSIPNAEGRWDEGKVDEDIYFWDKLREHGGRIWLAPRVEIGHAEEEIRWPGAGGTTERQGFRDYLEHGRARRRPVDAARTGVSQLADDRTTGNEVTR